MGLRGHIGKILQSVAVAALCLGTVGVAFSQTITKSSTSSGTLNTGAAWNGGVVPSGSSIAEWTNGVGGGTFTLGGNLTWGEIQIGNPNSAVVINSGSILTLNGVSGVGIDLSAATQNLTLNPSLVLGGAQAWNVGSGRTLTIGGTVNNGGFLLTLAGSGNTAMNGVISGAGGVTMNGTGVLTLSAANTYTGVTTINNGTLELDFTVSGAPSTDIIKSGTTLALGGGTLYAHGAKSTANDQTFGGVTLNLGDSEVIADAGNGSHPSTSIAFGAITRTIGSTVDFTPPAGGGTFSTSTGNANFSGGQATILGGYATVAGNDWAAISGSTIGALSSYSATFTAGKDVSTAAGTFAPGALTINSLRFGSAGAYTVNTGGNMTIATGGILETPTVGANGVSINNNTLTSGNGQDLIVIQNNTSGSLTIGSTIANNGTTSIGLTKAGTGTLALTGNNTYGGPTTINEGTLQVGNGSTTGALGSGLVTNNSVLAFDRSDTVTYSGVIAGSGSLAQSGGGTLILSANNTFTGGVNFNNGLIQASSLNNLGAGTALTFAGGGLQFGGVFDPSTRTMTFNAGGATLDTQGNNITLANAVGNGGAGGLTKLGTGMLTLDGNDSYSGATVVNGGILQLGASGVIPDGSAVTVNNSGEFDLNGKTETVGGLTISSGGLLTNGIAGAALTGGITNGGTVFVSQNTFFNSVVTNTGLFSWLGAISNNYVQTAGTNTLNGAATITQNATVDGGIFNLNGQTYSNNLMIVDGGAGVLSNGVAGATFNGGLSNAATVVVTANTFFNGIVTNMGAFLFQGTISNNFVNSGSGTVTLNNTATITKTTTINGGTFNLNGQTLSNGLMIVDGGNGVLTNAVAGATVNGGLSNSATVAVTADTFFNGPVTNVGAFFFQGAISNSLVNNGSFNLNNNATLTAAPINNGTINVGASTLTVIPDWANAGSIQISGGVLAGGNVTNNSGEGFIGSGTISNLVINNGTLTASGGTLTLAQAPINNGTAIVASASVLNVLPAWTNSGLLSNAPTGTVDGGTLTNAGTINGLGFFNEQVVNQNRMNFGGTISNNYLQTAGSFTVNGSGTITGTTTINGGTLDLAGGQLTNGLLVIGSGGTLTNGVQNATLNGGITNAGVVNLFRDTYINGPLTNTGTWIQRGAISNNVVNSGTMTLLTNSINLRVTGSIVNSGSLTFDTNGVIYVSGVVSNSGSFSFGDVISNNLVNTAGSITLNGAGTVTGNTIVNGGTLNLNGKRLTNALMVVSGTGVVTNSVAGATVNGGVSNASVMAFTANTFFNGVVTNTGAFFWQGAISNNYVQTAGTNTLNGAATITQNATVDGGIFNLNGQTYSNNLMIVDGGAGVLTNAIAGATFNGGLSNATTVAVTANTFFNGPVTNTGTFTFMGAVSNVLANSGNVILNGSGTVSALVNNGSVNVNSGTLSLLAAPVQNGSITVANGATVSAAQAWVNNGTITLLGGSITNAAITNNLFISGFGTIDGSGVVNNGKLFADASSISGVGTETVRIANFTNNVNATIGTASSNAVLNLLTTGNTLINRGTVSLSGGTILFNGGAGTITNFNIIAGVGNVANFPIVNAGTLASFIAQAPISGLSNLIATVGVTNNGLLGANNFINGAATLSLTVNGGGAAIVNHGTVALQGGFLTINGGAGTITNITNGLIYGVGTQNLQVANLGGGTIMASNGVFSLGLQSNANAGVLSNRNAASTILLTNRVLVNNGTIALNGGGLLLSSGAITNEGSIFGPGAFSSSVYNDTTGLISATNGVLNVATNLGETVSNLGQMTISSDGTLNIVSNWLNTNGTVSILGGDLTGGVVTNIGTVSGFGTISSQIVNQGGGTLTASGAGSLTLVDAPTQGGWVNIGNGATLNVLQSWLNSGTVNMQGGSLVGSTVTNAAAITGFGTITPLLRNNGGATFTVTGGTMTLAIAPTQIGTFVITNGGTLNVLAAWQNSGTVNLLGGDIIGSTVTNAGTMTGFGGVQNLVNNGGIFVTNGTLRATASFTQNSTVDIAANSRLDVTPTWSNNGSVLLNGGFISGGTMNNTAAGLLRGFGTVSNAVANLGTIVATNGTLSLVNALSQSGTITIANAATFNTAQAWQNNGLVNILGGTLAGATVTNAATISGSGVISAALSNTGYLRATNGQLSVQTLAGNQAAGILEASAGATLAVNGTTSWLNNGQLTLTGGTVIGGDISNNASHLITGAGTINVNVYNSGSIVANNGSQVLTLNNSLVNLAGGVVAANTGNLIVNGTFTNAGTLNMIHSAGTFSGAVVNSGAWVTDPTINVFQNTYTVTSSGYIQSSPGDLYVFSNNATTASSFINLSTNKNQFNTLGGNFVFANTLGATQQFATAGHDFGPGASSSTDMVVTTVNPLTLAAYSNNFALGTLQISDSTTVEVTDAFSLLGPGTNDGQEAALYLDNLYIGSNSLLLIAGNVQLYFINSNNWDMANIELEGNPGLDNSLNGIHQFAVVPEPSVLLLWLCGFATIYGARRRYARRR